MGVDSNVRKFQLEITVQILQILKYKRHNFRETGHKNFNCYPFTFMGASTLQICDFLGSQKVLQLHNLSLPHIQFCTDTISPSTWPG